ncbi:hypothetical protein ABT160_30610 [Streptomyces sp. NPDC001941]|uniref:4'-phosphopantetheinyl transferase family protein n=1 Tax=Streptomyces sp. NPDC001941 TaxID=3154659 RepID=UPI00332152CD
MTGARAAVARTAEVLARPGLTPDVLAPWERERLGLVRVPGRRDDVTAARLLLREQAARYLGCRPGEVEVAQYCPDCHRPHHGRPYLPGHPGVGISLSHADGLVAVAVGPGPTGVDVEPAGRTAPTPESFARRFPDRASALRRAASSTDPATALLRLWVEAEAHFKAGGGDLSVTTWTDDGRGAVVSVATAKGVVVEVTAR